MEGKRITHTEGWSGNETDINGYSSTCSLEDEGNVPSQPGEILEPNQCSVHSYSSA